MFGGASFLTADRIADSLVSLLIVLNAKHKSAVASIPVVLIGGAVVTATLLLGPTSAFVAIPEESFWPDPDAADAVTHLEFLGQAASAPGETGYSETIAVPAYEWGDPDVHEFW